MLIQDENSGREGRRYNEWMANRPHSRLIARTVAKEIEMSNLCDGCETAYNCTKQGECAAPLQPEQIAYSKTVVLQHHGRHRIVELTMYFDGDKLVNVTWEK